MSTMVIEFSFLTRDDVRVEGIIRDVPSFDPDLEKRRIWNLIEAWSGEKIHELLELESYTAESEEN